MSFLSGRRNEVPTIPRTTIPEGYTQGRPFELRGSILDIGILRDTLLPNLALHSGLYYIAYTIGRSTDSLEAKDVLFPASQVINAWWAAVGQRILIGGLSPSRAFTSLSRPEYLLLGGVTIWGGRLTYSMVQKARNRTRDPYARAKEERGGKESFWDGAFTSQFLPTAVLTSLISLSTTAPFVHQGGVFTGYHPWIQAAAIGLWGTGFAMEILAEIQEGRISASEKVGSAGKPHGVWSIVRHPQYLASALISASYPILLFSSDMLAPIELLSVAANIFFLKFSYVDADKNQSDPEINALWPAVSQVTNPWVWACFGVGAIVAGVEQGFHQMGLS